jgi:hypothetical protein
MRQRWGRGQHTGYSFDVIDITLADAGGQNGQGAVMINAYTPSAEWRDPGRAGIIMTSRQQDQRLSGTTFHSGPLAHVACSLLASKR